MGDMTWVADGGCFRGPTDDSIEDWTRQVGRDSYAVAAIVDYSISGRALRALGVHRLGVIGEWFEEWWPGFVLLLLLPALVPIAIIALAIVFAGLLVLLITAGLADHLGRVATAAAIVLAAWLIVSAGAW